MNSATRDARQIRELIKQAILNVRKDKDVEEPFAEYCEGIFDACLKALSIIAKD